MTRRQKADRIAALLIAAAMVLLAAAFTVLWQTLANGGR